MVLRENKAKQWGFNKTANGLIEFQGAGMDTVWLEKPCQKNKKQRYPELLGGGRGPRQRDKWSGNCGHEGSNTLDTTKKAKTLEHEVKWSRNIGVDVGG